MRTILMRAIIFSIGVFAFWFGAFPGTASSHGRRGTHALWYPSARFLSARGNPGLGEWRGRTARLGGRPRRNIFASCVVDGARRRGVWLSYRVGVAVTPPHHRSSFPRAAPWIPAGRGYLCCHLRLAMREIVQSLPPFSPNQGRILPGQVKSVGGGQLPAGSLTVGIGDDSGTWRSGFWLKHARRIPCRNLDMFAPPLSFAIALVALFKDRSRAWARTGLVVSFLTFALWLVFLAALQAEQHQKRGPPMAGPPARARP